MVKHVRSWNLRRASYASGKENIVLRAGRPQTIALVKINARNGADLTFFEVYPTYTAASSRGPARTGEVIGAKWSEISFQDKLGTIPAERMKAGKEHRVPLSSRAVEILEAIHPGSSAADGFVFPGNKAKKPLSNMAFLMLLRRMKRAGMTAHGLRSSFRDWCAERTNFPSEVAEMALAHAVGSKVEAAYRRGDLYGKRQQLMDHYGRAT